VGLEEFKGQKADIGSRNYEHTQMALRDCDTARIIFSLGELRLVLACLFKLPALVLDFVEQPNVLDGYARLVGEGRRNSGTPRTVR
jgi:hypothetical protein